MIKEIFDKLFKSTQNPPQNETVQMSQAEIEALVDAKVKEHTSTLQSSLTSNTSKNEPTSDENYTLSDKQVEYALSLIHKLNDFVLAIEPSKLTIKDLNRLIAFQRYKNKGTLVNLVKKGVLKRKNL